jgi:hypothetical protein
VPEGRPCVEAKECDQGGEPGFEYVCEKAGLAGTTSIGGSRVRYRGILQDPNEFALAIGLGLPLALTLWARRRSLVSTLLMAAIVRIGRDLHHFHRVANRTDGDLGGCRGLLRGSFRLARASRWVCSWPRQR